MYFRDQLKDKAAKVKDKKSTIGRDIDLTEFDKGLDSDNSLSDQGVAALSEDDQQQLVMAGLDITEKNRGGTFFQKDTSVVHCKSKQEGIEVIPIRTALETWIGLRSIITSWYQWMRINILLPLSWISITDM